MISTVIIAMIISKHKFAATNSGVQEMPLKIFFKSHEIQHQALSCLASNNFSFGYYSSSNF